MNRFCPNCGAAVPEGATYCPTCGHDLSQPAEQAQQEPSPPVTPTPPPAFPQAAAPGGPQQQPPAAPPPPPPPPATPGGGGSRRGLFIGGCAVAGVLGVLAILVIGALIFFFATQPGGTEPEPEPNPQPNPSPQPSPEPSPEPSPQPSPEPTPQPEPSPDEGSLDSLIQKQVGDFELQKIDTMPQVVSRGAVDARQMIYASPDGVQVLHILTAWSSAEVANQQLQPFGDELQSQGFELQKEIPLRNDEGQEVGTAQLLVGKDGEEVIIWTDDVLFCVVDTPQGYSVDFFGDLPY